MRQSARIVVGVDGSEQGERALDWAVAEASQWGAHLRVVHAWRFGVSSTDPNAAEAMRQIDRAAQHLLDHEVDRARRAGADVDGELVYKGAAQALIDASADADLLVVGNRGRGGVASTILGSVSTACVRHAHCPVVVVPNGDRAEHLRDPEQFEAVVG